MSGVYFVLLQVQLFVVGRRGRQTGRIHQHELNMLPVVSPDVRRTAVPIQDSRFTKPHWAVMQLGDQTSDRPQTSDLRPQAPALWFASSPQLSVEHCVGIEHRVRRADIVEGNQVGLSAVGRLQDELWDVPEGHSGVG